MADLGRLRQDKLPVRAAELRQKIRFALAEAQARYDKQHATEVKSMKRNEEKRDTSKHGKQMYAAGAKQDRKDVSTVQEQLDKDRTRYADACAAAGLSSEGCHVACVETALFFSMAGTAEKGRLLSKTVPTRYTRSLIWRSTSRFGRTSTELRKLS